MWLPRGRLAGKSVHAYDVPVTDSNNSQIELTALLSAMVERNASDLYLCEGKVPAMRIHGEVHSQGEVPSTKQQLRALLDRVLIGTAKARFERSGDLDVGYSVDGGQRFRLNVARQQGRLSVVARAVPSGALSFVDLGLTDSVAELAECRRGLVVVTGATGSGKSTTLAALVHKINQTRPVHIVTIEDPIEYLHHDNVARITQREVGADTASYQQALRHVVRQSPDVILVGEMRDVESIQVALAAALTGHLVLTTLHTIDATQTLQRMLNYFPEHLRAQVAMDLAQCLQGIVCQRLLPKANGEGRVVACEVMHCTPPVARLLRDLRVDDLQDLMRASRHPGLTTFNDALLTLFKDEKISFEVGMAYASNADEFALAAKGMSTGIFSFGRETVVDDVGMDMRGLLRMAMQRNASDLHLTSGRPPIIRVGGELESVGEMPLSDGDLRTLLYSIMSDRQRTTYELEREIDFALAIEDGRRFRINAYFQKGRMAAALRSIPGTIPSAEALSLPPELVKMGTASQGLLLVVGPTGSGKSTTLACLVDRINRTRKCRIITIEDPVEYAHESILATVDQRELYGDTQSFAAALKFILRQDPDVILVGEMRDYETISSVLTAAETGHLVLATMHSNDAVQAIDRIVDVFQAHQQGQARSQLSSSLLGVISQRLLPKKGGGLVPVFELMTATPAIRNLIRESKMHQARGTMEASRRDGMWTMDMALRDLYETGQVEYEDVIRYLANPRAIVAPAGRVSPPGRVTPPGGRGGSR
jgi:pilus retraction protein PilT